MILIVKMIHLIQNQPQILQAIHRRHQTAQQASPAKTQRQQKAAIAVAAKVKERN